VYPIVEPNQLRTALMQVLGRLSPDVRGALVLIAHAVIAADAPAPGGTTGGAAPVSGEAGGSRPTAAPATPQPRPGDIIVELVRRFLGDAPARTVWP